MVTQRILVPSFYVRVVVGELLKALRNQGFCFCGNGRRDCCPPEWTPKRFALKLRTGESICTVARASQPARRPEKAVLHSDSYSCAGPDPHFINRNRLPAGLPVFSTRPTSLGGLESEPVTNNLHLVTDRPGPRTGWWHSTPFIPLYRTRMKIPWLKSLTRRTSGLPSWPGCLAEPFSGCSLSSPRLAGMPCGSFMNTGGPTDWLRIGCGSKRSFANDLPHRGGGLRPHRAADGRAPPQLGPTVFDE